MQEALRPLAENLQRIRKERGLSLSGLARAANVSKSTVFKLERREANPSMDTLWSLAQALDVPFAALFTEDGSQPLFQVVRRSELPRVIRDGRGAFLGKNHKHDPHFVIRHLLSRHASRGELEVYSIEIDPKIERHAAAHSHGVIEHLYVTAGRIEIRVGGAVETIEEGDRASFLADREHVYRALDGAFASGIVILDYPYDGSTTSQNRSARKPLREKEHPS
jgi:XRE family transcriptional regulator, regulator of sulfur utilization